MTSLIRTPAIERLKSPSNLCFVPFTLPPMAQHQMDILLRSEQVKDIANDINRHSDFDPPLLGNYLPSQVS